MGTFSGSLRQKRLRCKKGWKCYVAKIRGRANFTNFHLVGRTLIVSHVLFDKKGEWPCYIIMNFLSDSIDA
jgi:hypothetical protein